jgi:SAM-dependent methyltransferase
MSKTGSTLEKASPGLRKDVMQDHDRNLASAFDGQAAQFERAPVQSDPAALERLVRGADLAPGSFVLDAGCGPGLVCEALLTAGHRVLGVDLSAEMISRARRRCAAFGARARFAQESLFDHDLAGPFDATISRYVLHHVTDPLGFVRRQVELLREGGVLVLCDHTTDPDPSAARHHQELERARDRTHTANLTPGGLVDLLSRAGLVELRLVEELFTLDFDEWFDRGTPADTKENVREALLSGPIASGFAPTLLPSGAVRIDCRRSIVRGVKPR